MPVLELRDGAGMAYAELGTGHPVLLVHGWAANGSFFSDLAQRLSTQHRVLTPTLRGHPGSQPGSLPLTIETLAGDLVELADALGVKSLTALGWSMGAMALWAAAPRLGARLDAMIVEDMGPRLVNDASWVEGICGGYGEADIAATVAEIRSDWPAYVARFAPRMFAPGARDRNAQLIDWATREMAAADGAAMAAFWQSMASQDFRHLLARIAAPMLVIRGQESQVYPDGATAHIACVAPNAKRLVIPGAGHVPHLEAPDVFLSNVEAFVRAARRGELMSGGAV